MKRRELISALPALVAFGCCVDPVRGQAIEFSEMAYRQQVDQKAKDLRERPKNIVTFPVGVSLTNSGGSLWHAATKASPFGKFAKQESLELELQIAYSDDFYRIDGQIPVLAYKNQGYLVRVEFRTVRESTDMYARFVVKNLYSYTSSNRVITKRNRKIPVSDIVVGRV